MTTLTHPLPGYKWRGSYGQRAGFYENGVWVPPMFHEGEDFSAPAGTPIRAAHAGTVVSNYHDRTGGWMVTLENGNMRTRYLHMRAKAPFAIGARVKAGQVIGAVGSTGAWTTGPHLHFEVWVNGRVQDPKPYLTKSTAKPSKPVTNKPTKLPEGGKKMMMIHRNINGKQTYAIFGAGFWMEFTGSDTAGKLLAQLTGTKGSHSVAVSASFWNHCKKASKA